MSDTPSPPPAAEPVVLARPIIESRPPWGSDLRLLEISAGSAAWDVILLLAVPIGLVYGPSLLIWFFQKQRELRSFDEITAAFKWVEFLLVAGLATYFIFRHGVRPRSLGIRFDGLGRQLLWGLAAFAGAYAYLIMTGLIAAPLIHFFGGESLLRDLEHRQELMKAVPVQSAWIVASLSLAVGLHEELLFRGLLLTHIRRATGHWWRALLFSSIFFGLLHFTQGWFAVIQVTGLAVLLGVFFITSRSLLAVAAAHFAFDFCQFQLIHVMNRLFESLKENTGGG
ncbi:MAG: CPBP family intramembrane metalloprotease [Planctomycetes bacterium]|nr:CPBP family intramembrane metalloprotease [Planctomycetota bacterium]